MKSLASLQALGHFSLYDYREPRAVPEELKGAFSVVVADPPYLVNSCPICIGRLASQCRGAECGFQCHCNTPILSAEQLTPLCILHWILSLLRLHWESLAYTQCWKVAALHRDSLGAGKWLKINVSKLSSASGLFSWLRSYPGTCRARNVCRRHWRL